MKKIRISRAIFWLLRIFLIFTLFSCKKTEIHLHDRHVLSYDLVKNYALKNGACTLVLLDYHHDIHPGQPSLTSVNWVSQLIEENLISKVYWLSGRTLLLPNRNSRFAWLERCLVDAYPDVADKMRNAVELVDWNDLQKIDLKTPFVVTLDFDVFTKDTDNAPDDFVKELCDWTQNQKPRLVTLAFSASYQKNPKQAWNWLKIFAENWQSKSDWFLESGIFGEQAESNDDTKAWRIWNAAPQIFKDYENPFYCGAYLWLKIPKDLKTVLLSKKIQAGNAEAENLISSWKDEKFSEFETHFNRRKLEDFAGLALNSLTEVWNGAKFEMPLQNNLTNGSFGLAVRFINSGLDRGCLSLYRGISVNDFEKAIKFCAQEASHDPRYPPILSSKAENLSVNISIFADWEEISSPLDFIPGFHSLIIEDESGEKTLLQSAIALERNYPREQFLSRLTKKAGLDENAWKEKPLKFYRAKTISFTSL